MRIVVTGATGLVGSALVPSLVADGHEVTRLVRRASNRPAGANVRDVLWNPAEGRLDAGEVEGQDAFVHLAGENVAGRWTEEKKRRIRESRAQGTRLAAETMAKLGRKPRVFVSASATGYYGADRGEEILTEESAPGGDFLADVCLAWEGACEPARAAGVRTVNLRIGVVLDAGGGALAKMLPPFRLGAGGRIGDGRQWMSWVALDDVVGVVKHALADESVSGPVNTVAPRPARNGEFTKALGRALNRPTVLPVPAFAVRLMFGEMGEALLLGGSRVEPARLRAAGYEFRHPELEGALRHTLGE